jgi:hypothetical protein
MSSSDKSSCNDDMIFTLGGNETTKYFQGHFNDGFYKTGVRPCFGHTCLEPVWSKGIKDSYIELHTMDTNVFY